MKCNKYNGRTPEFRGLRYLIKYNVLCDKFPLMSRFYLSCIDEWEIRKKWVWRDSFIKLISLSFANYVIQCIPISRHEL